MRMPRLSAFLALLLEQPFGDHAMHWMRLDGERKEIGNCC